MLSTVLCALNLFYAFIFKFTAVKVTGQQICHDVLHSFYVPQWNYETRASCRLIFLLCLT